MLNSDVVWLDFDNDLNPPGEEATRTLMINEDPVVAETGSPATGAGVVVARPPGSSKRSSSFEGGPELILRLAGPLRLLRRDGTDATPNGAMGRGLLALLAAAPALRRTRAWIQDKLWSDRPSEKGSACLRQTLRRLRREIGGDQRWLVTKAGWVALDPTRVTIVTKPCPKDWDVTGKPPDFCEGLDIADPEFEDWIRDHRLAYEDQFAQRRAPSVEACARLALAYVPPSLRAIAVVIVALPQADAAH